MVLKEIVDVMGSLLKLNLHKSVNIQVWSSKVGIWCNKQNLSSKFNIYTNTGYGLPTEGVICKHDTHYIVRVKKYWAEMFSVASYVVNYIS